MKNYLQNLPICIKQIQKNLRDLGINVERKNNRKYMALVQDMNDSYQMLVTQNMKSHLQIDLDLLNYNRFTSDVILYTLPTIKDIQYNSIDNFYGVINSEQCLKKQGIQKQIILYSRSVNKNFQFPKIFKNKIFDKIIWTSSKNKDLIELKNKNDFKAEIKNIFNVTQFSNDFKIMFEFGGQFFLQSLQQKEQIFEELSLTIRKGLPKNKNEICGPFIPKNLIQEKFSKKDEIFLGQDDLNYQYFLQTYVSNNQLFCEYLIINQLLFLNYNTLRTAAI